MTINLSGDLEGVDELHFFAGKGSSDFIRQHTISASGVSTYSYNWIPQEAGVYSLRVTANKNGSYVTHVVEGSITVEDTLDPLSIEFNTLTSGSNHKLSDVVNMDIELAGDLSDVTELQFLVRKGDGEFELKHTSSITSQNFYTYNWQPNDIGVYSVRVTAINNGAYINHVVLGAITIEALPDQPLRIMFNTLTSGETYQLSDMVNMDVDLTGDLSDATELQFLVRKGEGVFEVKYTSTITSETFYAFNWQAEEAGVYTLRVTATNNGSYVNHVVMGSIQILEPLELSFTDLIAGAVYGLDKIVKMDVLLSGDRSIIDELRFIVQEVGESGSVFHSTAVTKNSVLNSYNWLATHTGRFKLKVSAYKSGSYVTHVSLMVSVIEPIELTYRLLEEGQEYTIGDEVKMHVDITGDMTQADQIKFIVQKVGGSGVIDKTSALEVDENTYWNKWVPSEAGIYNLKVKAFKGGSSVAKVVAKITVLDSEVSLRQGDSLDLFASLDIFPNPTSGILYISSDEDVYYEILEISGKRLKSGKGDQIDLISYPSGVYFLLINGESLKIIKE